jgi:hypothetical protein
MNRIRLTLATALVGIARSLLRIGAFLTARLAEAEPVVHTSATAEALATMKAGGDRGNQYTGGKTSDDVYASSIGAASPNFDSLVSQIHRFTHVRARLFPGEGVAFALYVAAFSEAVAPALARYLASVAPAPPPETAVETAVEKTDDVN